MSLVDRTEYLIEQRLSKKFDIILGNMCIKCLFLKKILLSSERASQR